MKLLKWAQNKKIFRTRDVARSFRVSRQTASFHLKRLVEQRALFKQGSTRNAVYSLALLEDSPVTAPLKLVKNLKSLDVQAVLEEVQQRFPLKKHLSHNVQSIFQFAFQEMLSNSILHSQSKTCQIEIRLENGVFFFSVEDQGDGVFLSAQKSLGLQDELSAAFHLFRNCQKVFSGATGEWIFLASRIADRFVLSSHKVIAKVDNERKDFILLEGRYHKGTRVEFEIKARSKKNLQQYFQEFAQEKIEWKKNEARIQLVGDELVSRLQARRLLAGLEGMDRITFDFQNVQGIGQEFADEIFRVFQKKNSKTLLEAVHANLSVQFMIARVL